MKKFILSLFLTTTFNPLICKAENTTPPPKISVIMSTYNRADTGDTRNIITILG